MNSDVLKEENQLRLPPDEVHSKLSEPEEIIRAIREGEIDALVVQEQGQHAVYSLQRFDSAYRTVVEQCFPYGVWLARPDGELLYVTPSFLELLQTDLEEMREKGQFHFVPLEVRHALESQWASCRETAEPLNVEYKITLHDGSERAIWTQGLLARTPDGLSHWVGVNIDVTEREKIKDELRRQAEAVRLSEERFRLMADAMPQIVWVTRPDGYHEYYNRRWYDYIGCTPEECIGHGWNVPLHPEDRQRAIDRWNVALKTGEPYEIEYRFRRRDGQYRWFLGRALPVRDEAGHIIRWFGTCTDIDDKKKMEQALRQQAEALQEADRRKDEFLAMLGHELRNPLGAILNGFHILVLSERDDEGVGQVKAMMENQIGHLTQLVDDLLDVSRITRGKIHLRKQPVLLASAVNHAVESVRSLLDDRRHALTVLLPPQPVYVEADRTRLEQVLVNLLHNAAKYTSPGGTIRLTVEQEDGEVVIRVQDNGVGIRAEMLANVFDLFTQVDHTLERSQGGLGIGLTLAKRLVEMHGGSISAHSPGPDQGSEFVVRLPVISGAGCEPEAPPAAHSPGGRKLRVLVVDDSEDLAQSLKVLLQFSGHEVRVVHDGRAAPEAYGTYQPDVVLLDIGLAGMNGCEVARQLRQEQGTRRPLIVAMSGYGQEEDKRRALEAGCDEYLTKPVNPTRLAILIASAPSLAPPAP